MKLPVISWIVCVLALIGLVAWLGTGIVGVSRPARDTNKALIGGDFTLVDQNGTTVQARDFRGKYMLVYFGFTHCPDICPTSLLLIGNALEALGENGKKVVPIFISLDPERDTPAVLHDYVQHFGPRMVGLTGSMEQVKAAAEAYKVYFSKVEDEESALGYSVDHSGFMYLMGPDGTYITHFPHTIAEQSLVDGLREKVQ